MGPAYAIPVAVRNAGLTMKDIDVFEINEVCNAWSFFVSVLVIVPVKLVGHQFLFCIVFSHSLYVSCTLPYLHYFSLHLSHSYLFLSFIDLHFLTVLSSSSHISILSLNSPSSVLIPSLVPYTIPARITPHPHSNLQSSYPPCYSQAFASQCLFCVRHLGIPIEKVNPYGGAIALGHPLGCSGKNQ